MFSITLLLLLYAKHCKRGTLIAVGYGGSHSMNSRGGGINAPNLSSYRKNSGIDRSVVESLPVFRFGSLLGQKDGLECAVCLTRFESTEVLRLLPKCKHAFHVECVDTWLDAHSTCPLCRYRVDPEDILLVEDAKIFHHHQNQVPPPEPPPEDDDNEEEEEEDKDTVSNIESGRESTNSKFGRVSGRHSSAGERGTRFLQILVQKHLSGPATDTASCRRSLDSWSLQKKKNESVAMGCFDRPRKDGLLLTEGRQAQREDWSIESLYHPPDAVGSTRVTTRQQQRNMLVALQRNKEEEGEEEVMGNGNGNGIDGTALTLSSSSTATATTTGSPPVQISSVQRSSSFTIGGLHRKRRNLGISMNEESSGIKWVTECHNTSSSTGYSRVAPRVTWSNRPIVFPLI
ncbi:hypothetical protein FNV43_RR03175 [Rhamnella rubrinervis]|uniref:RING-type E3 ubiquitin transferase n=1 Tax=Rhamnella rubrinervis TaxID=2594499 RepID=A0A8K0HHI3_9ROSA|nr:hypothetical protein FNV43_RR03175 [Rhamnella rubrinervis]